MKEMADRAFTLEYPIDSGFKKTDIHFYSESPDLSSLFLTKKESFSRLFITDTTIASLDCMKDFVRYFFKDEEIAANKAAFCKSDGLLILDSGEKAKTIENVLLIAKTAVEKDFNRNSLFVAVGGGVLCDMTGFAASMFKRGINCTFVPTTLLADVDASVGGKTGCDFQTYKNMIGAFHPATALHIIPDFIKTLSEKEFRSGLAEAIKTAFLFSDELTSLFLEHKALIQNRESGVIFSIIQECAKAKADIVHKDFKEKNERAFLNLGHTFAHALESVAGLGSVTHGEAVAWGMARAACLSQKLGFCSSEYAQKVFKILSLYGYEVNANHCALRNLDSPYEKLLSAMHKDKKNSSGNIKVVLQKNFQSTFIHEVSDEDISFALKNDR